MKDACFHPHAETVGRLLPPVHWSALKTKFAAAVSLKHTFWSFVALKIVEAQAFEPFTVGWVAACASTANSNVA